MKATRRLPAWQRPTLPVPFGTSTIGAGGLNGRVRYGNGCVPSAIITRHSAIVLKSDGYQYNTAAFLLSSGNFCEMVELNGIEPMTSCLQGRRSPN